MGKLFGILLCLWLVSPATQAEDFSAGAPAIQAAGRAHMAVYCANGGGEEEIVVLELSGKQVIRLLSACVGAGYISFSGVDVTLRERGGVYELANASQEGKTLGRGPYRIAMAQSTAVEMIENGVLPKIGAYETAGHVGEAIASYEGMTDAQRLGYGPGEVTMADDARSFPVILAALLCMALFLVYIWFRRKRNAAG